MLFTSFGPGWECLALSYSAFRFLQCLGISVASKFFILLFAYFCGFLRKDTAAKFCILVLITIGGYFWMSISTKFCFYYLWHWEANFENKGILFFFILLPEFLGLHLKIYCYWNLNYVPYNLQNPMILILLLSLHGTFGGNLWP